MAFFENENFGLALKRITYLSLISLKHLGWTIEDEKDHNLDYTIAYICDFSSAENTLNI
jgi:hypothetical protein